MATEIFSTALDFIVPIASAGIVSMALVQSFKAIVPVQRIYQEAFIERWLLNGVLGENWLRACIGKPVTNKTCWGGAVWSFYAQDSKDIIEKLRMSGEMSIDYANTASNSLLFHEIITRLGFDQKEIAPWTDFLEGKPANGQGNKSAAEETERVRAAQAVRSLIQSTLRQHLSGIQLHMDKRWAQLNQLVAVMISAYLLWWLSPLESKQAFVGVSGLKEWVLTFAYCILGGVIAPFAKDLVTAFVSAKSDK